MAANSIVLAIPNIIIIRRVYVRGYVLVRSRGGTLEDAIAKYIYETNQNSLYMTQDYGYEYVFKNFFIQSGSTSRTKIAGHASYFHVIIFHIRSCARQHRTPERCLSMLHKRCCE